MIVLTRMGFFVKNPTSMRFDAIEAHVPTAYKKMVDSVAMHELPGKLADAMAKVKSGFHNAAIAAQTALRVDVA